MDNETANKFLVSLGGPDANSIVVMRPPVGPISKANALLLAAWLVALADDGQKFDSVLAAVQNT